MLYQWTTPWSAGDAIHVVADGADVSAFDASAPAPAPLSGLSPAWGASDDIAIATTAPFTITWTPDANATAMGLFLVAEDPAPPNDLRAAILCRVPDSGGTMTVPASMLGRIHPGDLAAASSLTREVSIPAGATGADVNIVLRTQGGGTAHFE